jgi:hypothetical protein
MTECTETTAPYAAWRRGAMIAAPIVLVVFSLLHGGDELVLRGIPDHDEWVRSVSRIPGRWLMRYRETLSAPDQPILDPVIEGLFFDYSGVPNVLGATASTAGGVGLIAAAVTVWQELGWRAGLPLAIAGLVMGVDHSAPFGALAGIMLSLAVWRFLTREQPHPAPWLAEAAAA